MGHLEEKHTAKQKAELAERMMFERQIQVCSSFYKNMKEELENFVKTQSFDFSEREGVLHYVSKQLVGMCMNKSYIISESNVARIIVKGTPDNFEIINAFPEGRVKTKFLEKYNFSDFDFSKYDSQAVEIFKELRREGFNNCEIRKNKVKAFFRTTVVKIYYKDNVVKFEKGEKTENGHLESEFVYKDMDSLLNLLELIRNYRPLGKSIF